MKPVVFFDMDGVLCDFVTAALRRHNSTLPIDQVEWCFPKEIGFTGVDDPKFWEPLGYEFWAGLDPYPDGLSLFRSVENLVGADRIGLLTSPCETAGCVDGKRYWVGKHLPDYRKRLFVGSAKELFASPNKVLIDDNDGNIDRFREAGGRFVLVPRPWNKGRNWCFGGGWFCVPTVYESVRCEVTAAAAALRKAG